MTFSVMVYSINAKNELILRNHSARNIYTAQVNSTDHRRLALRNDWFTKENVFTVNGKIPQTSCPLG